MKPLDLILAAGLALRATRFVTQDWLGEWWLVRPAKDWAWRYESEALTDRNIVWNTPEAEEVSPLTWQTKLVKGLDCPFCVGYWLGGAALLAAVILPRIPVLRHVWRFAAATMALNYVVGHISSRIDG